MPSSDTSSNSPSSSSDAPAQRFSAVRMPIEVPVEDREQAVEELRRCSSTELRRARKHHRRALESLRTGGYSNLSDATRRRLADRLRTNLEVLNRALAPASSGDDASAGRPSGDGETTSRSFSARFRTLFQGLW